jgi:hypothetical protein
MRLVTLVHSPTFSLRCSIKLYLAAPKITECEHELESFANPMTLASVPRPHTVYSTRFRRRSSMSSIREKI